jgi:putative transposase
MRHLNGVYTQKFNRKHGRPGHVFQGRYKAIIVDKEAYLLELSRYIVLNPVRAKLAATPEAYRWTSYAPMAGLSEPPPFLSTDWTLLQFIQEKATAHTLYREFVKRNFGNVVSYVA